MLLLVKPAHAPSDLVRKIKTNSSRWIYDTYANLIDFAWQNGFGVFSVSASAKDDAAAYIRDQKRHHRRMPFAEELRLFLEKHEIEHDPEHYLD